METIAVLLLAALLAAPVAASAGAGPGADGYPPTPEPDLLGAVEAALAQVRAAACPPLAAVAPCPA